MTRDLSAMGTLRTIELVRHKPGRQAFGADVRLLEPVAYRPELKLLVQRSVPGRPSESALPDGNQDLATGVTTAFHRLHTSEIDLGRRHDLCKELSPLPLRVEDIRDGDPFLLPLALECPEAIETATLVGDWTWRWRANRRVPQPVPGARPGSRSRPARSLRAATLLRQAGIHIGRHSGIRVATLSLTECARLLAIAQSAGCPERIVSPTAPLSRGRIAHSPESA
ncbi:MAG: hypothetical protein M3440_03050, partial [Chloroflexota bacterium]|nr:hypothetical protein [Chloroflexota bacterium]